AEKLASQQFADPLRSRRKVTGAANGGNPTSVVATPCPLNAIFAFLGPPVVMRIPRPLSLLFALRANPRRSAFQHARKSCENGEHSGGFGATKIVPGAPEGSASRRQAVYGSPSTTVGSPRSASATVPLLFHVHLSCGPPSIARAAGDVWIE